MGYQYEHVQGAASKKQIPDSDLCQPFKLLQGVQKTYVENNE